MTANRHDRMLLQELERMQRRPRRTRVLAISLASLSLISLGLLLVSGPCGSLAAVTAALCGGLIGSSVERLVFLHMIQLKDKGSAAALTIDNHKSSHDDINDSG